MFTMTLEEVREHVPGVITEDMANFANDFIFEYCHAIFFDKSGMAYCTHCGNSFRIPAGETYKHNGKAVCPCCGFGSKTKNDRYKHGSMNYWGYMTYYQKSAIDPNTVTAVGMHVVLNLSGEYRGVKPRFRPVDMFVFMPGKGSVRYTNILKDYFYKCNLQNFERINSIRSQWAYWSSHSYPYSKCCYTSYKTAVAGTPFERMGCLEYHVADNIEVLDMFSKWPSVEYIHKLGLKNIIEDKAEGFRTFGAIKWRGRTPLQVLGLTKADIKEIRTKIKYVSALTLYILRMSRKHGEKMSVTEAVDSEMTYNRDYDIILIMLKYGTLKRCTEYVNRQLEIADANGRHNYYSGHTVVADYEDYRKQCLELRLDTNDTAIAWPNDLYRAHQNLTVQIKIRDNRAMDGRIAEQSAKLTKFNFAFGGLRLRPFASSEEIIREGRELCHCVGSYVERYANGNTILCALRRETDIYKPWHTVEFSVKNGSLVQCRGYKNKTMPEEQPEIDAFFEAFFEQKQKRAERKTA